MTVWDVLTWGAMAVLGPGVIVICIAVARDLRHLLGGAASPLPDDRGPEG